MLWGSLAFAAMGAFAHKAGEYCAWQFVTVARTIVAFILAALITKAAGLHLVFRGTRPLWIRSAIGSVGMLFNFYAITHLPIADAITIHNTAPIWVALLAWLVLGQKQTQATWIAVLAGVLGIILVEQPHFHSGLLAALSAVGSALCTSVVMLSMNRLQDYDPRVVVTHFSGVSAVTAIVFLMLNPGQALMAPPQTGMAFFLLGMTGVAGVIGQLGLTIAFIRGQAARVAVVGLSQILFAFILDLVIWRRAVNAISVLGMLLVIAPTAWLILHGMTRRIKAMAEVEG